MRKTIAAIVLGITITALGTARGAEIDASTVLATLDESHPRLMLKDAELQKLKDACKTDKALQKCVADVIKYAEACLKKRPLIYKRSAHGCCMSRATA